jgi:hypothetical protein
MLYTEYRKTVLRLVTGRVPEWYKRTLLAEAFVPAREASE